MSVEEAYKEVERIRNEIKTKMNELSKTRPFINDTLHEILELYERVKEEITKLKSIEKEISKKLSSNEFEFIKNNFDIKEEDLNPKKYKNYDEISYILKIKTYHAYNWDYFLEPWIKYYETLDKIKLYLKEFKNKVKIVNFYVKLGSFSTNSIDSLLYD